MDYTFSAPSISSVVIEGTTYSRVTMSGTTNTGEPGAPALPSARACILVPWGEPVTDIQVIGNEALIGTGYQVEPVGKPFAISVGPTD